MFYNIPGGSATGNQVIPGTYEDTTDWQLILLDLVSGFGSIGYFRYDTFTSSKACDVLEIESIRIFKTKEGALKAYKNKYCKKKIYICMTVP